MRKITKTLTIVFFATLIAFIASSVLYNIQNSKQEHIEDFKKMLYQEAIAHFENMVNTRIWNASFNGLYVLPSGDLKPNPYLKTKSHIYTSDGKKLIKINPAWMTRQISEISNAKGGYLYKITSLKPINPHNAPDTFEKKALQSFEKDKSVKFYTQFDNNYYHLMGALKVEKSCLKCHKKQGYKVGDIRGGLHVSIPLMNYDENVASIEKRSTNLSIGVTLVALILFALVSYIVKLIFKRQESVEEMNKVLEEKVKKRTLSLETLLGQEKYLKDILFIATQVNESLITSFSIHAITKNCINQLTTNNAYGNLWIGFITHENSIDVLAKSEDLNTVITKDTYDVTNSFDIIPKTIFEAYSIVKTQIIEVESEQKKDFDAKQYIYIPIKHTTSEYVRGVLCLGIDKEEGFLEEEVSLLETMANDISLAIQTLTQKNVLDKMEMDKIENYENTILAFVNMIEQRDTYTAGHTIRVAEYCRKIAEEFNIQEEEVSKLEKAAILHDIGKVATPDAILLKPSGLNKLEYELIKHHSKAGYDMLSKIEMYKDLAEIIKYHHSRYDGKGYPQTDSSDEIPFLSHIMIIADAFDAMTTNRIYKPRMQVSEAIREVQACSGTQFHPEIAETAVKVLAKVKIQENSQMPVNELEKKRFSYFFQDYLTSMFNENYLEIILSHKETLGKKLLYIELRNFSEYNKKRGWSKGSELLKSLAHTLHERFEDSLLFRFHGDDFILIDTLVPRKEAIEAILNKELQETAISVVVSEFVIDEGFSLEILHS